jgi:hypothetical protein
VPASALSVLWGNPPLFVSDEKTYRVRRRDSPEREYRLHELTWLWRSAALPHDAVFRDVDGIWKPLGELVDPLLNSTSEIAGVAHDTPTVRRAIPWQWLAATTVVLLGAIALGLEWKRREPSPRHTKEPEKAEGERPALHADFIQGSSFLPGMTPEQVRRTLGPPRAIKATADGSLQRWLYRQQTVVFENGKVVGIEASP